MPQLSSFNNNYWIVKINLHLIPTRKERWNKGIIRRWGRELGDTSNNERLMYILYPKETYSKGYMESVILSQYTVCPLCTIGRPRQRYGLSLSKPKEKIGSVNKGVIGIIGLSAIPLIILGLRELLRKDP